MPSMRNFIRLLSLFLGGFLLFFVFSVISKEHAFAEVMMFFGGMSVGLVAGFTLGLNNGA